MEKRISRDTFFVSKNVTTRPRRLSQKGCVKNFYLNKTDLIITVNTSKVINSQSVKWHMKTPLEETVSDRLHSQLSIAEEIPQHPQIRR